MKADVDPSSLLRRLVERITFGATQAEVALAESLGYEGYLEHHLSVGDAAEDPLLTARLATIPTLSYTGAQLFDPALVPNQGIVSTQLQDATVLRQAFSVRQFYERMVDFWSDHFSIEINIDTVRVLKMLDDRLVIRPHALGFFPAMLSASAQSPAMLSYLDNDQSRAGALNENYARELMELHTLGVDGGYTQQDVVEVARCFTGWDWWRANANPPELRGTFRYRNDRHDNNAKTLSPVFNLDNPGQPLVIPAGGGMGDGLLVLDILGRHPTTARYIAKKLCRRLVGEQCPQSTVDAAAAAYMNNGQGQIGDIKAMVRAVLRPNILADSPKRLKRPNHLVASMLRLVVRNVNDVTSTSTLRTSHLGAMGHLPFAWNAPDGYPDFDGYWSGQVLPRWNTGMRMLSNTGGTAGGISGVVVDGAVLTAIFPTQNTRAQVLDRINELFFGGGLPAGERAVIESYLPAAGNLTNAQKRDAVGLALAARPFSGAEAVISLGGRA